MCQFIRVVARQSANKVYQKQTFVSVLLFLSITIPLKVLGTLTTSTWSAGCCSLMFELATRGTNLVFDFNNAGLLLLITVVIYAESWSRRSCFSFYVHLTILFSLFLLGYLLQYNPLQRWSQTTSQWRFYYQDGFLDFCGRSVTLSNYVDTLCIINVSFCKYEMPEKACSSKCKN